MTAILPPSERLWWKHPLDRVEGTWIAIAFAWCMVMFFMMIYWHAYGNQNLSTETYKTTPDKFAAKAQAVVDKYTVRTETEQKVPVVAPPPGSDVYLVARLWNWWPILELEKGRTYRLHLTAMDYLDFASPVAGLGSKMGLDATNKWPGETQREWGRTIVMDAAVRERAREICEALGL